MFLITVPIILGIVMNFSLYFIYSYHKRKLDRLFSEDQKRVAEFFNKSIVMYDKIVKDYKEEIRTLSLLEIATNEKNNIAKKDLH